MQAMTERRDGLIEAGRWLREQREAAGLTQQELAMSFGGKTQNVSAYENGIHRPSDDKAAAMASRLDIPVSEMRRMFGLYVPEGSDDTAVREVDVLDAIRRDPRLLPEARRHLMNQYKLLLRVSPGEGGTAATPPPTSPEGPGGDLLELPHAARKRRGPRKST